MNKLLSKKRKKEIYRKMKGYMWAVVSIFFMKSSIKDIASKR